MDRHRTSSQKEAAGEEHVFIAVLLLSLVGLFHPGLSLLVLRARHRAGPTEERL